MKPALALLACLGVLACTPLEPDNTPKPNASEGTHYHQAGPGAVLRCNSWGFETICRSSSSR